MSKVQDSNRKSYHSGLATKHELRHVELELKQEIQLLRKDMDHRFETINYRFEKTDQKIEKLELKIGLQISKNTNKLLVWFFSFSFTLSSGLLAVMAKGFHWV